MTPSQTKPRLYIAGPYAQGDVVLNIRTAIQAAELAITKGWTPFLPHLYHLWHLASPHPTNFWYELDMGWLPACEALLRLPGESAGADREAQVATQLRLPTFEGLDLLPEAELFLQAYWKARDTPAQHPKPDQQARRPWAAPTLPVAGPAAPKGPNPMICGLFEIQCLDCRWRAFRLTRDTQMPRIAEKHFLNSGCLPWKVRWRCRAAIFTKYKYLEPKP